MGKQGKATEITPGETPVGSTTQAWAGLHLATLLFGVAGLFGKWLTIHPLMISLGRVCFATAALGLFLVSTRRWPPRVPRSDWPWLAASGVLLAFHWGAFFQSIQISSVAIGLLAYATAPLFTALLEPVWFRESFSGRALAAAAVTVMGIGLIAPRWDLSDAVAQGLAWGIAAGGSFAVLSLFNRRLRARHDSAVLTFWQDGAAALVLLPVLWWEGSWLTPREWVLLGVLGVVCTALAHGLFVHALLHLRAHTAVLVSNLEPVYGIALAAVLLDEIPSARTLLGGVVVLAAVTWHSVNHPDKPVPDQ